MKKAPPLGPLQNSRHISGKLCAIPVCPPQPTAPVPGGVSVFSWLEIIWRRSCQTIPSSEDLLRAAKAVNSGDLLSTVSTD